MGRDPEPGKSSNRTAAALCWSFFIARGGKKLQATAAPELLVLFHG
jgi:hypothetical protein